MGVTESFLAFLDTETGGLVPGRDPIIEIATILTDMNLKELARFEAKIQLRGGDVVSPEAAAINGYDPEIWAREAVPFQEYIDFLIQRIPRGHVAVPIGHNVGYDRDMIEQGYYKPRRLFLPLGYRKVDTVSLCMVLRTSGMIDVPDVKLPTITKALGIEHGRAHSAMADCLAAKAIYERFNTFFRLAKLRQETATA